MKATSKSGKTLLDKKPKSNLQAALGKYKNVIQEQEDCWDEDLKKSISTR